MRNGADIGRTKPLWDWIGGSSGFDCGFPSPSGLASHFGGAQHGLRLAVLVTAASGSLVGCVDYLVAGSYAVSDRQADGSYIFITGYSSTPIVISTGCTASPAPTVRVELFIDYSSSGSDTRYVAGYTAHYLAAPQHVLYDARIVLSGPDGGACAHEPPLFRFPAAAAARPITNVTAGTLTFSAAAATPQLVEAARPFRLQAARSGGFAAVMALALHSDPAATGQRQQLWRMDGSVARLAIEVDTSGRIAAELSYTGNATQFRVETAAAVPVGTVFVTSLVYDHAALTFELYQDGALASADTAASLAVAAAGGIGDLPMHEATVSSATAPLDAAVHYVAVFDRALSAARVSTLSARFLQAGPICSEMQLEGGVLLVASGADAGVCDRAVSPVLVPPSSAAFAPTLSPPALALSNAYGDPTVQRLELGSALGNMLTLDFGGRSQAGVAVAIALLIYSLPPAGSEAMLVSLHSSLFVPDVMALRLAVQADGAVRLSISASSGGPWSTYNVVSTTPVSAGVWAVVVGNYIGVTQQMGVWIDGVDVTAPADAAAAAAQIVSDGGLSERVFTAGAIGMDWNDSGPAGSPFPGKVKYVAVFDHWLADVQVPGLSATFSGSVPVCADVQKDMRVQTRSASTPQDGPFCPFSDPVISQSSNPTFAPTRVSDGWEFEASNGLGKGFKMPETLHEVSRGGLTWVTELRFDTDPTTRGNEMQVFQFRTPTNDRRAGLYTNAATGDLEFKVCISSGCEVVGTAPPVAGVWMTVAARYVHGDRRMELWVDGRLVGWADTLSARAQLESTAGIEAVQFGGAFGLHVNQAWTISNPLTGTSTYFSAFDAALSDAQLHHLLAAYVQGGSAADCGALFVDKGMMTGYAGVSPGSASFFTENLPPPIQPSPPPPAPPPFPPPPPPPNPPPSPPPPQPPSSPPPPPPSPPAPPPPVPPTPPPSPPPNPSHRPSPHPSTKPAAKPVPTTRPLHPSAKPAAEPVPTTHPPHPFTKPAAEPAPTAASQPATESTPTPSQPSSTPTAPATAPTFPTAARATPPPAAPSPPQLDVPNHPPLLLLLSPNTTYLPNTLTIPQVYVHDFETPYDVTFAIVELPTLLAYLRSPTLLATLPYNPTTDLYGPLTLTYTARDPQGLTSSITQPAFLGASAILCPAPERRCPDVRCSVLALCLPTLTPAVAQPAYIPPLDAAPPTLTLLGDAPTHSLVVYAGVGTVMETRVPVGHAYIDAGATAFDAIEGYLTLWVVARGAAAVQTAHPTPEGQPFRITYTVADSAGNVAVALRNVYVDCPAGRRRCVAEDYGGWYCSLDTQVCVGVADMVRTAAAVATELTLLGAAEVWVQMGVGYGRCPDGEYPLLLSCDPGAVARHPVEGDVTAYITACGARYLFTEYGVAACGINATVIGDYTITFALQDSGTGVVVEAQRVVHVVAKLPQGIAGAVGRTVSEDVMLLATASAPELPSAGARSGPVVRLKPLGPSALSVDVPRGWAYRACGGGSFQTSGTVCEPGAEAEDAEGTSLTDRVLSCPPDACLPFGCPGHEFSGKGLDSCGIDTIQAAVGTEYSLPFVVFDHSVPPLMATATRYVRVVEPCASGETYCPSVPSQLCGTAPCSLRASLADPDPPPPPTIAFSASIIPELVAASAVAGLDMHVTCGARPPLPASWCRSDSTPDCLVRAGWQGGDAEQLVELSYRPDPPVVQCTALQIAAGSCEDCSLQAVNSGLCHAGSHTFMFNLFAKGASAASGASAKVRIHIMKRLVKIGATVMGRVSLATTADAVVSDEQLREILVAVSGQAPLTNELLWAAREAVQAELLAAMGSPACAALVQVLGTATNDVWVDVERTGASMSAIASAGPGGLGMLVQVNEPVEILFTAHQAEVARAVSARAESQAAMQQCASEALSAAGPGWPGSTPSVVRQLRSRGAIASDAVAEGTLEVAVDASAVVLADACPMPSVESAASASADELFGNISAFLQHEVAPTLAALDVLDLNIQGHAHLQSALQLGILFCSMVHEVSARNTEHARDAAVAAKKLSNLFPAAHEWQMRGGEAMELPDLDGSLRAVAAGPTSEARKCMSELADIISQHSSGASLAGTSGALLSGSIVPVVKRLFLTSTHQTEGPANSTTGTALATPHSSSSSSIRGEHQNTPIVATVRSLLSGRAVSWEGTGAIVEELGKDGPSAAVPLRRRTIGSGLEMIGGVVIGQHELPNTPSHCGRRFSALVQACATVQSSEQVLNAHHTEPRSRTLPGAVGHDPAFMPTNPLYRPELEGRQGVFYNVSTKAGDVRPGSMLPYGFFRNPLPYLNVPFPVVFQTQQSQSEVMRILNMLTEGMYLSHSSRSVDVRFGSYHPERNIFGLVKLRFKGHSGSAYQLQPVIQAIAGAARGHGASLFTAVVLRLSWFALAATTICLCLSHLGLGQAVPDQPGWKPSAGGLRIPGSFVMQGLDVLLIVAQGAAAVAYVVVEILAAQLPTPSSIAAAALQSLYHDVNADARILLPAKVVAPMADSHGEIVAVGDSASREEDFVACGVLHPWQLWAMPTWTLPDDSEGVRAFGRDMVALEQSISARSVYFGLQAAVVAVALLKWACLVGQLHHVQPLACTLVALASPLLHLGAACGAVIVPVAFLVYLLAGERLEQASSLIGTLSLLWNKFLNGDLAVLSFLDPNKGSVEMSEVERFNTGVMKLVIPLSTGLLRLLAAATVIHGLRMVATSSQHVSGGFSSRNKVRAWHWSVSVPDFLARSPLFQGDPASQHGTSDRVPDPLRHQFSQDGVTTFAAKSASGRYLLPVPQRCALYNTRAVMYFFCAAKFLCDKSRRRLRGTIEALQSASGRAVGTTPRRRLHHMHATTRILLGFPRFCTTCIAPPGTPGRRDVSRNSAASSGGDPALVPGESSRQVHRCRAPPAATSPGRQQEAEERGAAQLQRPPCRAARIPLLPPANGPHACQPAACSELDSGWRRRVEQEAGSDAVMELWAHCATEATLRRPGVAAAAGHAWFAAVRQLQTGHSDTSGGDRIWHNAATVQHDVPSPVTPFSLLNTYQAAAEDGRRAAEHVSAPGSFSVLVGLRGFAEPRDGSQSGVGVGEQAAVPDSVVTPDQTDSAGVESGDGLDALLLPVAWQHFTWAQDKVKVAAMEASLAGFQTIWDVLERQIRQRHLLWLERCITRPAPLLRSIGMRLQASAQHTPDMQVLMCSDARYDGSSGSIRIPRGRLQTRGSTLSSESTLSSLSVDLTLLGRPNKSRLSTAQRRIAAAAARFGGKVMRAAAGAAERCACLLRGDSGEEEQRRHDREAVLQALLADGALLRAVGAPPQQLPGVLLTCQHVALELLQRSGCSARHRARQWPDWPVVRCGSECEGATRAPARSAGGPGDNTGTANLQNLRKDLLLKHAAAVAACKWLQNCVEGAAVELRQSLEDVRRARADMHTTAAALQQFLLLRGCCVDS
eukprot:jgi/Ulvmu1/1898/UM012_0056.1